MKTLIKNAYILTMNNNMDEYKKGYIEIEDENITRIGYEETFDEKEYNKVIDAEEGIILPGMINTHTHIGMIPFRSLGDDYKDRLRRFLFPLEKECMNSELAVSSGKYAVAEMLLGGVTTFADMYYFENDIARACEEMKTRCFLGETVIDAPSCDSEMPSGGLKHAENFVKAWQNHHLITPMIAPHAPNTNSKEGLRKAKEISDKYRVPFTIHLSEMDYEMEYFKKEYNMTPVEYLESINVLGERMIAAHCIHLTDKDINILKKYDVKIAHCIGANTKAAKGVAPVKKMLEAGLKVGLGTDGPSSGNTLDIFTQLKLFANFHKNENKDRSIFPAKDIVRLATIEGARVLGVENIIGSLEPGKKADFIIVETKSANMFPIFDPYSVLVYSANASNVESVFVNGFQVVKNKKLINFDLMSLKRELKNKMVCFEEKSKEFEG
jgi:cytosine/adenosine deaminase-related metal-dependent hydrolase